MDGRNMMLWAWLAMGMTAMTESQMVDKTISCIAVTTIYNISVTCDFKMDISRSKHNFNIQFYQPDLSAEPEPILMCNWLVTGVLDCRKPRSFSFNNVVSDMMKLEGPQMVNRMPGKFVCELVPSTDIPVQPCSLTYKHVPPTTPTPKIITHGPVKDGHEETQAIILVLVAVTVVAIFGFCLSWFASKAYRYRRSLFQRCVLKTETKEEQKAIGECLDVKMALRQPLMSVHLGRGDQVTTHSEAITKVDKEPTPFPMCEPESEAREHDVEENPEAENDATVPEEAKWKRGFFARFLSKSKPSNKAEADVATDHRALMAAKNEENIPAYKSSAHGVPSSSSVSARGPNSRASNVV